jgi:hypothetical protein
LTKENTILVTIATIGTVLTVSGVMLLLMDWLLDRRGVPSCISMRAMYPVLAFVVMGGFAQLDERSYFIVLYVIALLLAFAGPPLASWLYRVRPQAR